MNGPLDWYAAVSGVIAAALIAWDHSRKVSGWAFVLFVTTSIAWIVSSLINKTAPLAIQNVLMLGINLLGVYRYLIRKKASS